MAFDPSTPIIKENISALRANISPYENISTQGYLTQADSGGASYYYNPSDTTSSDNGTTIIVDAAGHRYYRITTSGITSIGANANVSLTVGDLGQFIDAYGTCTITLPDATSSPPGSDLLFINTGGVTTVVCDGSDLVLVNAGASVTSFTLNSGDTLFLVRATNGGTPCWFALGGSVQLPYSGVFAGFAPIASPHFTGTPTAPTASPGTNTTQLATTAFVATSFAPLASPALTGTPTAPTASSGTNTTQLATTAFVEAAIASNGGSIQGTFKNLKVTNGATANSQVAITVDEIALETSGNLYYTARTVSVTASTGSSGANGLDTGSVAASTWYSVWVIYNGTTVASLLSLSSTTPTLPSGYTYKARVGWVLTDGSRNLMRTLQYGRKTQYQVTAATNTATLPGMAGGTATAWTAVAIAAFVPPTACRIDVSAFSDGSGFDVGVVPNNGYATSGGLTNVYPLFITSGDFITVEMAIEGSNIYWSSAGSVDNALACFGWEDNL